MHLCNFYVWKGCIPFSSPSLKGMSEQESECELHKSRSSQRIQVLSELGRIIGKRRLSPAHIVADRIGCIECLPAEFQTALLSKREILRDAGVDVEHAIADYAVPYARLSRPLWAERCFRSCWIGEDIWSDPNSIHNCILGIRRFRRRAVRHRVAFDVPVRSPREAVVNRDGEAAGPPEDSGNVPPADQFI